MKNMKRFWIGLLALTLTVPGWSQGTRVKVDPKVKVEKKVKVKVDPQIDVDIDPDFDIDIREFEANVEAFGERTARNLLSSMGLEVDDEGGAVEYQETSQEVEIPLTKPGERGTLDVGSHNGMVKITGYDGPTVKVKVIKYQKKVSDSKKEGGMRLVSSGGLSFEATEYNNVVKVENDGWNDRVDFEIQVPRNFDIKADAYNNGKIEIDGVTGELNVESYNGPITLTNISGSASASTYNGSIEVTFTKVTPDAPMAFSTYNGNVDLSVPDGTKFTTKMKTNREIYTDFESFSIKQSKPVTSKSDKGRFNIKYENWVEADLNGGGAEVMMKTTNGDIYIRKK